LETACPELASGVPEIKINIGRERILVFAVFNFV
jgi:hypothetical protein